MNQAGSLEGQVAPVAGATRGSGKAIAIEFAICEAKVYFTGRSTSEDPGDRGRNRRAGRAAG